MALCPRWKHTPSATTTSGVPAGCPSGRYIVLGRTILLRPSFIATTLHPARRRPAVNGRTRQGKDYFPGRPPRYSGGALEVLEVVPVVGGAVQQRSFDPPPLFNKAASGSPMAEGREVRCREGVLLLGRCTCAPTSGGPGCRPRRGNAGSRASRRGRLGPWNDQARHER